MILYPIFGPTHIHITIYNYIYIYEPPLNLGNTSSICKYDPICVYNKSPIYKLKLPELDDRMIGHLTGITLLFTMKILAFFRWQFFHQPIGTGKNNEVSSVDFLWMRNPQLPVSLERKFSWLKARWTPATGIRAGPFSSRGIWRSRWRKPDTWQARQYLIRASQINASPLMLWLWLVYVGFRFFLSQNARCLLWDVSLFKFSIYHKWEDDPLSDLT